MGRTLLALVFVGLLGFGGWKAYRHFRPATEARDVAAAGRSGPGGQGGAAPPAALQQAPASAVAPAPASSPAALASAGALRTRLQAGKAREAVAAARGLPPETLRAPEVASASRDAALALAAAPGAGPADRALRADEARRLLGALVLADAVPMAAVQERLQDLNREVLLSGRAVPGVSFSYTVKAGDTLDRLLRRDWRGRVKVGAGLLLYLNSIPGPDRLRPVPIVVPEEGMRIVVRKRDHQLWAVLGEVPFRVFPVGLGMHGRTPEGRFLVEEMQPKPDYWPAGKGRVPFGHPDNPLGTRWLGFKDTPEAQGIGIHGTADPSSIGKDLSQGCVRLHNADVETLFSWVTVGTEVEIRP